MFREDEFRSALKRKGHSISGISQLLGIDQSTLYRKMSGISDFTRNEIQMIKTALTLSNEEVDSIFFSAELTFTQDS